MRILLGLILVVTLALVTSSRQWWGLRRTAVGAALTTGGWLGVAIGILLGPSVAGLVQVEQVAVLKPLVLFCLGWVGLMVGLQAHRQLPQMLPGEATRLAGRDAVLSILLIGGAAYLVLALAVPDMPLTEGLILAALLGTCAISWSPELRSLRHVGTDDRGLRALLRGASGVGSMLAVFCYGLLFAGIRHDPHLSLSALGLGVGVAMSAVMAVTLGLMTWWLARAARRSDAEFLVVLLGVVSFIAGGAAVLGYSPLFVSLLCGAVVTNVPGDALTRFRKVIVNAEQPMAMALMLVAGLLADPYIGVTGAVLVVVLIVVRLLAKRAASRGEVIRAAGPVQPDSPLRRAAVRQSPLAIALAIGYAISSHAEHTAGLFSAQRLLMVVILVGVICDALPWIGQVGWSGEPADKPRPSAQEPAS